MSAAALALTRDGLLLLGCAESLEVEDGFENLACSVVALA